MKRPLLPALAMTAALALPAQALDLETMTEAERQIFRTEIRNYLLENPEVIMEAVAILEQRDARAQAQADTDLIAAHADAIFDDEQSWVGGNPDGDVTLVEFMDYRCSYCRRAAPDVTDLIEFDGNIRFVLKEFPILGEQSMLSSRFAIATRQVAGDDAYKAVHDALMTFKGDIDETALQRLGGTLGLDTDAIMAEMNSAQVTQVIAANHQLAQKLGISGTPSFVMGDRLLRGYMPREAMEELVAEIRSDFVKPLIVAALLAACPGGAARAETDFGALTSAERAILQNEIREVLLTVPELLPQARPSPVPEAVEIYAGAIESDLARIAAHTDALFAAALPGFGAADAAVTVALFTEEDCPDCARAEAELRQLARTHDLRVTVLDMAENGALARALELDTAPSYVFPDQMLRGHIPAIVLGRYLSE